jgi:hypothetical protein
MENCMPAPANPLENVADLLREELKECHYFIKSCFEDAASAKSTYDMQQNAMKLAARLIQASSGLAIAIRRLEGTSQEIVVKHGA